MGDSIRSLEHLRPYTPGTSGAKGLPQRLYARVHRMARAKSIEALEVQLRLMRDASQPGSVRLAAASAVLDRAWGKAPERIELGGDSSQPMLLIRIVDPGGEANEIIELGASEPQPADGFTLKLGGGK